MVDDDAFQREGGEKGKYDSDINNFSAKEKGLDGVKRDRGCTDILCLIVFLGTIVAMGYCTIYGYKHGQVAKFVAPLDKND